MIPIPTQEKRERILYLPIFEQGWQVQKEQKIGLRDALARIGIVSEFDYFSRHAQVGKDRMMQELSVINNQLRPTLVLTQCHNSDILNANDIKSLRGNCSNETIFVNWNGDYWPEQLLDDNGIRLAKSFDYQTVVNRDVVEKHQLQGINTYYWQIGFEPEGTNYNPEIYHDIVFLASGYSEKRQKLGQFLKSLGENFGIYGDRWPNNWSKGENLYNFREACKIYRGAKIAIGDSQWPESGFVSNRVFQILAAGNCVLFHQWFRGMENLGLIDEETCVIWKKEKDLRAKIRIYLNDEEKRKRIAANGEKLALKHHSFDSRVNELLVLIGKKGEDNWR